MGGEITCKLCLENSPVVYMGNAAIHGYGPSHEGYGKNRAEWRVCADSDFIPDGVQVAEKCQIIQG